MWWTASPISPAAPAQTTRETKLFSQKAAVHRFDPVCWDTFSCIDLLVITIIVGSHYSWFSGLPKLSLKRSNPADMKELEAADRSRCSVTDTALLDNKFLFSKSDTGRDNRSLWSSWVACSCAVSHTRAHARTLDWLGFPNNKIRRPFDLFQSLMKFHWQKRFIVGKRVVIAVCLRWSPLSKRKQDGIELLDLLMLACTRLSSLPGFVSFFVCDYIRVARICSFRGFSLETQATDNTDAGNVLYLAKHQRKLSRPIKWRQSIIGSQVKWIMCSYVCAG